MVAGSYLMVMVDKVRCLHTVVGAADKAVLAVADSSKLHTSKGNNGFLFEL